MKFMIIHVFRDVLNKLEQKADDRGLTLSELVRDIIWRYLNDKSRKI